MGERERKRERSQNQRGRWIGRSYVDGRGQQQEGETSQIQCCSKQEKEWERRVGSSLNGRDTPNPSMVWSRDGNVKEWAL